MVSEHWLVEYSRKVHKDIVAGIGRMEVDDLVDDVENFPHAFVLACCMDRQVSAERAWHIPKVIASLCGEFSVEELCSLPLEWYQQVFEEHSLHRYNGIMAEVFHSAVHRISSEYGGDASRIWSGKPNSAEVVYRFLEFDGVGRKIATMAANLLHREHNVEFSDYCSIDISPDVQIQRIFKRTGLVLPEADVDAIMYRARSICPEYPGILDAACWNLGRGYCKPSSPQCDSCPVSAHCPKKIGAAV